MNSRKGWPQREAKKSTNLVRLIAKDQRPRGSNSTRQLGSDKEGVGEKRKGKDAHAPGQRDRKNAYSKGRTGKSSDVTADVTVPVRSVDATVLVEKLSFSSQPTSQ
jgi:hypothetical protein